MTMMTFWEIYSFGTDVVGLVMSVAQSDAEHFAVAFTSLLRRVGKYAKVKEITPEKAAQAAPHIQALYELFSS